MKIEDLALIEELDLIFDNDIVIWGAGVEGHNLVDFLWESIGCKPLYICDKDCKKWGNLFSGTEICSVQSIIEKGAKDFIIIISSTLYLDDMLNDIIQSGVACKGVYTYMAAWYAVNLNLSNRRVKELYRHLYHVRLYYGEKKLRDEMVYYSPIRMAKNITAEEQPILVFQPGKVGSNTVYQSLLSRGVNAIHLHSFPEHLYLQKKFIQEGIEQVKIITLVREPIARDISDFIQYFEWDYLMTERMHVEQMSSDIEKKLIESMRNQSSTGYGLEFDWFDKELKELTGIDVFKYPFDKEKGYSIISENKYQILLLTLERLKQNAEIVGQFCGISKFYMKNANEGESKRYKYLYANLMEKIKVPEDIIKNYYCNNTHMDYFYSEEMKQEFLKKYL